MKLTREKLGEWSGAELRKTYLFVIGELNINTQNKHKLARENRWTMKLLCRYVLCINRDLETTNQVSFHFWLFLNVQLMESTLNLWFYTSLLKSNSTCELTRLEGVEFTRDFDNHVYAAATRSCILKSDIHRISYRSFSSEPLTSIPVIFWLIPHVSLVLHFVELYSKIRSRDLNSPLSVVFCLCLNACVPTCSLAWTLTN